MPEKTLNRTHRTNEVIFKIKQRLSNRFEIVSGLSLFILKIILTHEKNNISTSLFSREHCSFLLENISEEQINGHIIHIKNELESIIFTINLK